MRRSLSIKQTIAYFVAVFVLAVHPMAVFASQTEPPAETPVESSTAPAESKPADKAPAPPAKPERNYRYNPETKRWDSDQWTYNPDSRRYEATPPPSKPVAPEAVAEASSEPDDVDETGKSTAEIDAVNSTTVDNLLDSIATSGSATVSGNTNASHATSGDAAATATIINNLNSSISNANNTKAATFVTDVMGDVSGDIMLKPMLLKAMLESEADDSSAMSIKNTSQITNDINLTATSGDASVTGNTKAGDATTGSAHAVANVVNIINSMIAANQSFVGTINIYGNLDGDILIAPDFIPQLLTSNAKTPGAPLAPAKNLIVDANDTQTIINNVNLNATSGTAVVEGNTTAGNASSGMAGTNTVIFNMTGHDVVAENSLLVFVNVLGKWVGVIVDAPVGATSAVLGSGVTDHTRQAPDLSITAENDVQITNNLLLNSTTGNAVVSGNTYAGSATSGDATASANIANISNTQFGLSGWFGVLYINVFGSWFGSLGIDTEAGSRRTSVDQPRESRSADPVEFIPRSARPLPTPSVIPLVFGYALNASQSDSTEQQQDEEGVVLAAARTEGGQMSPVVAEAADQGGLHPAVTLLAAATVFVGGLGLTIASSGRLSSLFRLIRR